MPTAKKKNPSKQTAARARWDKPEESGDGARPPHDKPAPRRKKRAGADRVVRASSCVPVRAGQTAGHRASWLAAAVLFISFDGMLDDCHVHDAFDGRLEESSWEMNEFGSDLRTCAAWNR